MAVVNFELDRATSDAVDVRLREKGCETIEEYVRALIVDDLDSILPAEIDAILARRMESDDFVDSTPAFWADVERRVQSRLNADAATRQRTA